MKMTESKKIRNSTASKKKSKSILIGSIVALFIAITPYLFYIYNYFPDQPTYNAWLFTYESKFNLSIQITMWLLMGKVVPLFLLILWFFTCKHWWYHSILIPIAMYAFQIFGMIANDLQYIDVVEIYWLIPIMLVITPFVYFIRVKLFDKHVLGIDLEAMDAELKGYKEKERLQKEKEAEDKML